MTSNSLESCTYVVTLRATGAEVYRYSASAPVEWAGFEFATHDHVAQADPLPAASPSPEPQAWERTVFMRRFTAAERIRARALRVTDPILNDFWDLLESSPSVHSNDAELRLGMHYLVMIGVLSGERMDAILGDA